jgi:hypothetical protein
MTSHIVWLFPANSIFFLLRSSEFLGEASSLNEQIALEDNVDYRWS